MADHRADRAGADGEVGKIRFDAVAVERLREKRLQRLPHERSAVLARHESSEREFVHAISSRSGPRGLAIERA